MWIQQQISILNFCSSLLEWYLLKGQTLHQESLAKVFFGYFRDTESLYGLLLELETQPLVQTTSRIKANTSITFFF